MRSGRIRVSCYWSESGDPSVPVDPGRERLLAAFEAGMAAARKEGDMHPFDLVAVGSVKRPPDDYFVAAPFYDPDAPADHSNAPDEWAMCGWCRHQVMLREFDPGRAVWIHESRAARVLRHGRGGDGVHQGVSNEWRRGGEDQGEALDAPLDSSKIGCWHSSRGHGSVCRGWQDACPSPCGRRQSSSDAESAKRVRRNPEVAAG